MLALVLGLIAAAGGWEGRRVGELCDEGGCTATR